MIEANTDTYGYDETWKDKLISYNGQTITYDAVGNPTNYMGNALTWTMGRQLATFGDISYTYNESGIRTSKTSDDVTTKFYLDGTNVIEQTDGTITLYFFYDSVGEIVGFKYNGNNYLYVKNSMGDVIGVADDDGNLIASYTYDAWGNIVAETNASGNAPTTLAQHWSDINPFRYRGYYYDKEIGLYYVFSRYYDATVGRFINSDASSLITSSLNAVVNKNLFAYCDNNPVVREDVSGAIWESAWDAVSLTVSVIDVAANPTDPWAWVGLVGDAVDLALPFVGGLGETVKVTKTVTKSFDKADETIDLLQTVSKADNTADTVKSTKKGWKVGDDIEVKTRAGNNPKWSTSRQRYWKNEAYYNKYLYPDSDIELMKKGRAPLVQHENGKYYPMELHHKQPQSKGGSHSYNNLEKVTPWKHAEIDPSRHFVP